ncbi:PQQ-like beta-propeller repeat protein [Microvirga zambiensis]|uniref:Vgb family protein n=1 Tax=Microvirga zambiensis TaxID=1402137 RepID=UPI00191FD2BE|nr:PQQ-like beta-propeller repeat protein [Microvirga zambiensis]
MPSVPCRSVTTIALFLASSMLSARAEPLIYATGGVGTDLLAIDAKTGETKVIGQFGYPGSAPLAFGPDGKLYTVTDSMRHENSRSQLATVDPGTSKATPIGEPLDKTVRIMALGPGPDGGLYASGVMENRLYRIDPQTGVFTEIGPFKGGRDVMDFATNPKDGAMYATTPTALYRLDPKTAELAEVARYSDVPPSVMGIVFDRDGTLYATNYGGESALYRVDPATGRGEKIAIFPERNVHSADMKPGG